MYIQNPALSELCQTDQSLSNSTLEMHQTICAVFVPYLSAHGVKQCYRSMMLYLSVLYSEFSANCTVIFNIPFKRLTTSVLLLVLFTMLPKM